MKTIILFISVFAFILLIAAGLFIRRKAERGEIKSAALGFVLTGFTGLLTAAFFAAYYTESAQACASFFFLLITACAIAFFASEKK